MRGALFILMAALLGGPRAWAASVEASLDRTSIAIHENARLSIAFRDVTPTEAPRLPAVAGLTFTQVGRFDQSSVINGQSTRTITFHYAVRPSRTGQFIIPALTVPAGGAQHSTQPLALTVTATPAANTNQLQMAFLKIVPPARDVYVGEVIPLEIQLYYVAGRGDQIQHPQLKGDGFTVIKRLDQPPQSQTTIQNARFQVVSFRLSISPAKAGELELGPASVAMILQMGQASSRRLLDLSDLFNSDPIFGGYERRQVEITAPPIKLNVLPLPGGAPPSFTGAIGNFGLSAEVTPTNAAAGDPLTLRVVVEGKGSLDALTLPEFKWNNFQVYPPNTKVEHDDPLGMTGRKIFEYAIVPQNAGVKALPEIALSYFDPERKAYQTVSRAPIPLAIAPSPAQAALPPGAATPAPQPEEPRDIRHIKPRMGPLVALASKPLLPPWLIGLNVAPAALFCAAFLWRKQRERSAREPSRQRGKELGARNRQTLAELRALASENRHEEFYSALFRLLQDQVAHHLDRPAVGITEADLTQLQAAGAGGELVERIRSLFHACDQARYARSSTPASLSAVLESAERVVAEINSARIEKGAAA